MTIAEETAAEMAADESGAASNEDMHREIRPG
jgi:hypothetical protein